MKKIILNFDENPDRRRAATVSLRLDYDTLRWFRKKRKKGYTTLMADILRAYKEANR